MLRRILAERFLPQKAGSLRTDVHILGSVFSREAVFCRKNFPFGIWFNKDLEIDGNLFGDHLTEKLAGSKNISERVNVFTTEYAKLRGKELADGIQKLENYLRERIYDTDGCICIRQLAEETGYSECYIRRVFQQVHGISPKNFERFVRFQKLLHVINKMPERIRLDALAQQCGYYDEAHMIKDFKQYAGITPQGYERLITGTKIPELEL